MDTNQQMLIKSLLSIYRSTRSSRTSRNDTVSISCASMTLPDFNGKHIQFDSNMDVEFIRNSKQCIYFAKRFQIGKQSSPKPTLVMELNAFLTCLTTSHAGAFGPFETTPKFEELKREKNKEKLKVFENNWDKNATSELIANVKKNPFSDETNMLLRTLDVHIMSYNETVYFFVWKFPGDLYDIAGYKLIEHVALPVGLYNFDIDDSAQIKLDKNLLERLIDPNLPLIANNGTLTEKLRLDFRDGGGIHGLETNGLVLPMIGTNWWDYGFSGIPAAAYDKFARISNNFYKNFNIACFPCYDWHHAYVFHTDASGQLFTMASFKAFLSKNGKRVSEILADSSKKDVEYFLDWVEMYKTNCNRLIGVVADSSR